MSDDIPRRSRFRPEISLGNLLTIFAMVIAGTGAWIDVRTAMTEIRTKQIYLERRLTALEDSEDQRQADRVSFYQVISEIRADIKYLREAVERQSEK